MELGRQNKSLNFTSISGALRINVACKIVLQSALPNSQHLMETFEKHSV